MVSENDRKAKMAKPVKPRVRISPEITRQVIERVISLVDPVCASEQMELVHVEYQREPHGVVLRLYIDKPGGVSLEDCVRLSRQISDLLDVHLEMAGAYHLEVSSPGLDRPISRPRDFERFKGERVRIRMRNPLDGKKTITGLLMGWDDGVVLVQSGSGMLRVPHADIGKTRLVYSNGEI